MVLDPIPQSLPVHFFGSRPQPPTSHVVLDRASTNNTSTIGEFVHKRGRNNLQSQRYSCVYIQYHIENHNVQYHIENYNSTVSHWELQYSITLRITITMWITMCINKQYHWLWRIPTSNGGFFFQTQRYNCDYIQFSITVSIVQNSRISSLL